MTNNEIVREIDVCAAKDGSFYFTEVRKTWVRRWVPFNWFGLTVADARAMLMEDE